MVQPFDYTLKTPSTTESFLAGVQAYQNQQKAMRHKLLLKLRHEQIRLRFDEANNFSRRAEGVRE
jgi:hypothetical protein